MEIKKKMKGAVHGMGNEIYKRHVIYRGMKSIGSHNIDGTKIWRVNVLNRLIQSSTGCNLTSFSPQAC